MFTYAVTGTTSPLPCDWGAGQCFTEGVVQSLTSWALILEQPLCSCDFGQDTEWLTALVSSLEKWDNTSIPTEKGGKVNKAKC